ncbi:hypothetical protein SFUMM280S_03274 [Streptomyces fumanus]
MTTAAYRTGTLRSVPALPPLLARGALLSPVKRPRPGAEFPRVRLVLPGLTADLAKLAAYERVCGFPVGKDTLPVTYPHVLGFPLAMRLMSAREFPLPLLGLVHTSLDITRRGPLPAGEPYELAVHVAGLAPHRRGTEATVVTELRPLTNCARAGSRGGSPAAPTWPGMARRTAPSPPGRGPTPFPYGPSGGSPGTSGAGTPPRPGTATRSTCTRSPPASSASPAPSRTACGRPPGAWPSTAHRRR